MKLSVIGLAVAPRRDRGATVASAQQQAVVALLQATPGLSIHQVRDIAPYADRTQVERALQGLIRKGYLRWELNPLTRGLKYYVTSEGKQWLTRQNRSAEPAQ